MLAGARVNIAKLIRFSLFLIIVTGCAIVGISYYTVRNATYRLEPSAEQQELRIHEREQLMRDYDAQPVTFTTQDEVTLHGLLILRPNAKRTMLICHGYRMAKENMAAFVPLFPHDNILLFDFRAHGQSAGDIISIGCYEQLDVKAAVKFLCSHHATAQLPIIGIGLSMGGATLLCVAAQGLPFQALIIDSAFANLMEQIASSFSVRTGLPKIIFMPSVIALYELLAGCSPTSVMPAVEIEKIHCPIFLIHAEDDIKVPVTDAYRLYVSAREPKQLWLVKGSSHANEVWDFPEEYAQKIHSFIKEYAE